jgi:dTDP-4-amino-4,6-dideoxygalactose transaminase
LALLTLDLAPEEEVVVPSFTFVSCANAVLIAGGLPVFADINPQTQNLSLASFKSLVTEKTRAVIVVHYAGIASELYEIIAFARLHNIVVIEDAAHCLGSLFNGQELGTFGDFGCFSFHETKNITCGEGGALVVNNDKHVTRVEIIREKGTDRSRFLRGQVDKYTWRDRGSSYLPSEITAAFLCAQLDDIDLVTQERKKSWDHYQELMIETVQEGLLTCPVVPFGCNPNGHIYYILLNNSDLRSELIKSLKRLQIQTTFHYVPLHSSPFGKKYRSDPNGMQFTEINAERLLRLPLWFGLDSISRNLIAHSLRLILKNK